MKIVAALGLLLIAGPVLPGREEAEPIFTEAEFAAVQRENGWWRLVRVEDEVAVIEQRWREAGCAEAELRALRPKLAAIWAVAPARQFGWLTPETVEKIKEVDITYGRLLRAARLRHVTGIRVGEGATLTPPQVEAQWQRAVRRVLAIEEVAEFAFMNSPVARRVGEWTEGLSLTEDERRTLIEWQREFLAVHGAPETWPGLGASERAWHEQAYAAWFDRVHALLRDERAAAYLARAHPQFGRMCIALAALDLSAAAKLRLWGLRQEYYQGLPEAATWPVRRARQQVWQERVAQLLGAEDYAAYAKQEEARWLFPRTPTRGEKQVSRSAR